MNQFDPRYMQLLIMNKKKEITAISFKLSDGEEIEFIKKTGDVWTASCGCRFTPHDTDWERQSCKKHSGIEFPICSTITKLT